jgi:putative flippase GtrA
MAANLVAMRLLVDDLGLHYLAANLVATATAGIANFFLSELVVFIAPLPGEEERQRAEGLA